MFNQITRERVVGISTLNYDLTTTLCCHQILYLSTCFTLLNLQWRQMKPSVYVLNFLETEKWVSLNVVKVKVLVSQSHPTLWDPMDCGPPCFSVHGILLARRLEWVAVSFFRRSSPPRDWTWVSFIAADSLLFEPSGKPTGCRDVN